LSNDAPLYPEFPVEPIHIAPLQGQGFADTKAEAHE
jgi:hypothetical protein